MNVSFNALYNALKRALLVALISVGLWAVSTPAYAADADDYYTNDRGGLQATERYEKIQPETGEYNNFEDVDPRRETKAAEAKARTLIDTAKRRNAQASDPLEPAREAVSNLKGNLSETADKVTDKVNYQAEKAADRLGRSAERAAERVKN